MLVIRMRRLSTGNGIHANTQMHSAPTSVDSVRNVPHFIIPRTAKARCPMNNDRLRRIQTAGKHRSGGRLYSHRWRVSSRSDAVSNWILSNKTLANVYDGQNQQIVSITYSVRVIICRPIFQSFHEHVAFSSYI